MDISTPETRFIIDWIGRMNVKYGACVYDLSTRRCWDWGQALCRERFGPVWMNTDEYKAANEDGPFPKDVEIAKRWETGEFPEWVNMGTLRVAEEANNE